MLTRTLFTLAIGTGLVLGAIGVGAVPFVLPVAFGSVR